MKYLDVVHTSQAGLPWLDYHRFGTVPSRYNDDNGCFAYKDPYQHHHQEYSQLHVKSNGSFNYSLMDRHPSLVSNYVTVAHHLPDDRHCGYHRGNDEMMYREIDWNFIQVKYDDGKSKPSFLEDVSTSSFESLKSRRITLIPSGMIPSRSLCDFEQPYQYQILPTCTSSTSTGHSTKSSTTVLPDTNFTSSSHHEHYFKLKKEAILTPLLMSAHEKYNMKSYEEAYLICMNIHDMDPSCLQNLLLVGCILFKFGMYDEVLRCNSDILRWDPHFAEAYSNMGSAYRILGNHELAMVCYRYAIHLKPYFWDAYDNMASLYLQYHYSDWQLSIRPPISSEGCYFKHHKTELNLIAYQNLAKLFQDEHNLQAAINTYVAALRHHPNPNFFNNLGILLSQAGRLDEAISSYYHGLELDSKHIHLMTNLGSAYKEKGDSNGAIRCYLTSLELNPHFHIALVNLANLYKDLGKINEAIETYDQVLTTFPDSPEALCNCLHARLSICDWSNRDRDLKKMQAIVTRQLETNELPSVLPFHCFIYPIHENAIKSISAKHAEKVARLISLSFSHDSTIRRSKDRLRVGYVSSDFGGHPLSHLMQSVFGFHDRKRFEIFCYATSSDDGSSYRRKIHDESEHFIDLTYLSNEEAAKHIYQDHIDILVNLNGYTKGARNEIFVARPAPLQVSYLGFPGTMGASFMHYLITDIVTTPPDTTNDYTEHLIYMPHSYFVTDHRQSFQSILQHALLPKRSDLFPNLSDDTIIFANFNQMYKIDPTIFDSWMTILRNVPNSVLWLLRFPAAAEVHLLREAKYRGIASDRVLFTDVVSKEDYILRSTLADIFLDTPECNGHTTAADVLWAGVPIITYPKRKMASRVCSSLCEATGLGSYMIAHSYAEYEQKAIELATDHSLRYHLRTQLEISRHSSPLFDTRLWVHHLEVAYLKIWNQFVEQGGMMNSIYVNLSD